MKKELRILIYVLSSFGLGLAVGLCYQTGWGADPITVFFDGLNKVFKISLGTANTLTALVMITIVFFIDKKQLGLGTIITPFAVQFGIDYGMVWFPALTDFYIRCLGLIIGFIALGFFIAVNISCDIGQGSYDALVLSLVKVFKKTYSFFRWIIDGTLLLTGYLMGGKVSIANFLAFIVMGKIVDFFIVRLKKWGLKAKK